MIKKIISAFIAGTMLISGASFAEATSIKEKKAKNAEEQRKLKKSIQNHEHKISKEQETINKLDARVNEKIFQVAEKNKQIEQLEKKITELEKEIRLYEEELKSKEQELGDRLRVLQENDGNSIKWEEIIFGAKDLGNLISRVMAGKKITEQDDKLITEYREMQEKLTRAKEELDEKKVERLSEKKVLEQQKAELKSEMRLRSEKLKKLRKGKTKITTQLMKAKDVQAILEAQERAIAAEKAAAAAAAKAAKAAAARAKANSANSVASSISVPSNPGKFIRPVGGGISQGFGPASGQYGYTFHNGTDFTGSVGTPIVAAATGTVITAQSGGPYGNHVMITHLIDGQVYTTVYAHMNSLNVSAGQRVSQGQQIGTLGNTGNSSGPHLHFEIHVGGYQFSASGPANTVNPLAYL
ncbi:murein hydrolase activator EnvC family protein [Exiguobacterium flavidum]|uniref:murein hydrolase activator EnvC family protein n=1 Tax=Exiguobacterium flavidum TaxID=2184695 RepID=UPI000DF7E7F1|nr:M23 family metallopeptidase [Exiguobacterium flavidum]